MGDLRMRTCVACRKKAEKGDMLRLARTAWGTEPDVRQKMAGRGAYVCSAACMQKALKTKGLERALRTRLTEAEKEKIAAVAVELPR